MKINYSKASHYTRIFALSVAAITLIGVKIAHAHCWDIHVHTEIDDRQHETWKEGNATDRYNDICDKEDRGENLSDSEKREQESYEVDHIN